MEALTSRELRYPVLGHASVIECPVHRCVVALNDAGRISSRCPECLRLQTRARHRWRQRRYRERLAG